MPVRAGVVCKQRRERGSPALLLTSGNRKGARGVQGGENDNVVVEEDPTFNLPLFLLPQVEGLCLEEVVAEAQQLCITVATTTVQAPCPVCGVASSRVQSRDPRTVADLPWADLAIRLLVRVRWFRCDHPTCARAIFCERLGPAIAASARRTQRLERRLQHVSLALGGEAGARQLSTEAIAASPDMLLRLIRHLDLRAVPTPRVLGGDPDGRPLAFDRGT